MNPRQSTSMGIDLRQGAQTNMPPAICKNLNIPRIPTCVLGIPPTLFLKNFLNLLQKRNSFSSLLTPKSQLPCSPKGKTRACIFFGSLNNGFRRTFSPQPGEVPRPIPHQGLDEREIKYRQSGQHGVMTCFHSSQNHKGKSRNECRSHHE